MTAAAPPEVCITEFTDPGCPWAYSAETFRRRLRDIDFEAAREELGHVAEECHVGFDGFWSLPRA